MSNLGTIRANVRANLSEAVAKYFEDTDLNTFIGEAFAHYTLAMIKEGEGFFQTTTNLGLVVNTESIDLTALNPTFYSLARLERRTTTGTIPLRPSERRFETNSILNTGTGDGYQPNYRIQGTNLILEPYPLFTEAASATTGLKLDYNYLPTLPSALTADNFTFDASFPTIFEPMIQLWATIAALESKDGIGGVSDIASFRERLVKWEERLADSLERFEYPDNVQYIGVDYNNSNWIWY